VLLRSRWLLPLLVAVPAAAVALGGLAHPVLLTPETAERWRLVHLVLLPLFPLIGASVWLLLLGVRGAPAWAARILALAYAVLYTALDSIAGIGGGHQMARTAERGDPRPPVEDLYDIGDPLGQTGVVALAAALALTAFVLWRRGGGLLAPLGGLIAVAGCYPFLQHHVFPQRGVAGLLAVAVGTALLAVAVQWDAGRSMSRR
jgi:hypothetical protein